MSGEERQRGGTTKFSRCEGSQYSPEPESRLDQSKEGGRTRETWPALRARFLIRTGAGATPPLQSSRWFASRRSAVRVNLLGDVLRLPFGGSPAPKLCLAAPSERRAVLASQLFQQATNQVSRCDNPDQLVPIAHHGDRVEVRP